MERLGNMTIEERKVVNTKKQYKMDEWNVGQTKGLFIYDVATSDRERMENLIQGFKDIDIQDDENIDEMVDDIADEIEALDINQLSENYMDGQYYSEDEEDDF